MKKLYYVQTYIEHSLYIKVFTIEDCDIKSVFTIPCKIHDNILFIIENYLEENNIVLEFDELIPL